MHNISAMIQLKYEANTVPWGKAMHPERNFVSRNAFKRKPQLNVFNILSELFSLEKMCGLWKNADLLLVELMAWLAFFNETTRFVPSAILYKNLVCFHSRTLALEARRQNLVINFCVSISWRNSCIHTRLQIDQDYIINITKWLTVCLSWLGIHAFLFALLWRCF